MEGVYATCGHEITLALVERDSNDFVYWWPDWDRSGQKAWSYGVLCAECVSIYNAQKEEPLWN